MKRYILAGLLAAGAASPAFADDEYYVVREESSRECKVVTEVPRESTWVRVGDVAFKTRDEADERVSVLCRDDDDDDGDRVVEYHRE